MIVVWIISAVALTAVVLLVFGYQRVSIDKPPRLRIYFVEVGQ